MRGASGVKVGELVGVRLGVRLGVSDGVHEGVALDVTDGVNEEVTLGGMLDGTSVPVERVVGVETRGVVDETGIPVGVSVPVRGLAQLVTKRTSKDADKILLNIGSLSPVQANSPPTRECHGARIP